MAALGSEDIERVFRQEHGRAVAVLVRRFDPEPPLSAGCIIMVDPEGNEFCLD